MKKEIFQLLDVLNRDGISNEMWGVVQDVHTREYFGTSEDIHLEGHFLYVYREYSDINLWLNAWVERYGATYESFLDCDNSIQFFCLD